MHQFSVTLPQTMSSRSVSALPSTPVAGVPVGHARPLPELGRPVPEYERLVPELQRIVAGNVRASAGVVEEACQIAWSQWLVNEARLDHEAPLGWLSTAATRAALRLLRREAKRSARGWSACGTDQTANAPLEDADPQRIVELRERLAKLRRLPTRQQRMIWLQGLGYDYREIGARTGATPRTVERQLLSARRRLAEAE